jgi:hypothetical protein
VATTPPPVPVTSIAAIEAARNADVDISTALDPVPVFSPPKSSPQIPSILRI